jgi:hypothetical protein
MVVPRVLLKNNFWDGVRLLRDDRRDARGMRAEWRGGRFVTTATRLRVQEVRNFRGFLQ